VEHLNIIQLEVLMYMCVYYRRKLQNCLLITMFTFGVISKKNVCVSSESLRFVENKYALEQLESTKCRN